MIKSVATLLPAVQINMGGIFVKQALPTQKVNQVDPFLLLHHGKFTFTDRAPARQQGIGPHPHRGFSPVTFVVDGEVHHRDSRGNNQIAKKGEVQWMNAGAGITHSERPSQNLVEQNGTQEIIQVWINTPADKKMSPPRYQFIESGKFPKLVSTDGSIINKLIAGDYNGKQGPFEAESELLIMWGEANASGEDILHVPEGYNSMIYVILGNAKIAGYGLIEAEHLVVFNPEGSEIKIGAKEGAQFLLLAGKALREKVVQQGPFVMNSETEILEAMRDYQMGKMGILIED